jgi:hypothetical protein
MWSEWRESPGEMWVHHFMTLHISLLLLFSVQYPFLFINSNLHNCSCNCICCSSNYICIAFIVCSVSFIVCIFLCVVLFECGVLFCVMCVICVLWLIVVPLPPGKDTFAVKINNKKYKGFDGLDMKEKTNAEFEWRTLLLKAATLKRQRW